MENELDYFYKGTDDFYIDGLTVLYISLGILMISLLASIYCFAKKILPELKAGEKPATKDIILFVVMFSLFVCSIVWIWVN